MKIELKLIGLLIIGLAIVACWEFIELMFLPHSHPPVYTQGWSQMKQIGTATAIYLTDYDDRFPHTTSMPGTRVCLQPYMKNAELFKAIDKICDEPTYNFNLSGSIATDPPLGYKKPFDPLKIVMWYSFLQNTKTPEAIIVSSDTAANRVPQIQVYEALKFQFDRTGVTLAPADYLVDQDPFR